MYDIHISQVKNGYIVNINQIISTAVPTAGNDFESMMGRVAEKMQKGMEKDSVLSSIHEQNQNNDFLGTHVCKTFEEVLALIKLIQE